MKMTGLWLESGLMGKLEGLKDDPRTARSGGTPVDPPVMTLLPRNALLPLLPTWRGFPVPVQTVILDKIREIPIPELDLYDGVAEMSEAKTGKKTWVAPLRGQTVNEYVAQVGTTLVREIYERASLSRCKTAPLPPEEDALAMVRGVAVNRCYYVTLSNNQKGNPWKSLGGLTRKELSDALGLSGRIGKGPSVGMMFADLSGTDAGFTLPASYATRVPAGKPASELLPAYGSPRAIELLNSVGTSSVEQCVFYYGVDAKDHKLDEGGALSAYPDALWIASSYEYGSWEGSGTAIVAMPDGKYFIEDCSHCSCNGPTDKWGSATAIDRAKLFSLLDKDLNGKPITSAWGSEHLPDLWRAVKAALLVEIGLSKDKQARLEADQIEESMVSADLDLV